MGNRTVSKSEELKEVVAENPLFEESNTSPHSVKLVWTSDPHPIPSTHPIHSQPSIHVRFQRTMDSQTEKQFETFVKNACESSEDDSATSQERPKMTAWEKMMDEAIKSGAITCFEEDKMQILFCSLIQDPRKWNDPAFKAHVICNAPWLGFHPSMYCCHCAEYVMKADSLDAIVAQETNEEKKEDLLKLNFSRRVWYCFTIYYVVNHLDSEATGMAVNYAFQIQFQAIRYKYGLVRDSVFHTYCRSLDSWIATVAANLDDIQFEVVKKHLNGE